MSHSVTQPRTAGPHEPESHSRSISAFFAVFLIVAAAVSPVLTIWAGNIGQIPKLERLVLISFGYLVLGALVFWLLRAILGDSRVAGFASFFTLLVLTSGGEVFDGWPWVWRWVTGVITVGVVVVIVVRLRNLWALDVMLAALAAALMVPALISGLWAAVNDIGPGSGPPRATTVPVLSSKPDIVLVVLDGYTSLPVLRELFGFEDAELVDDLARSGFRVVEPVFTPYSMTHLAVSSLLELDYVAAESTSVSDVLGGENRLVEVLSGNGYRITMVEPGWHMTECGSQIDQCVPSPFIDESVDAVLSQSMFWAFIEPVVGSAFTAGARHSMDWARSHVQELVGNDRPDFLFLHVVAPHPPLYLDGACDIVDEGHRRDLEFAEVTSVGPEIAAARLDGYADQVECVNGFIRGLANAVTGSDTVVFVTGDHGSDALSQIATPPMEWSDSQVLDRMGTFLAVKAPDGCEPAPSLTTLSVLRSIISCTGDLNLGEIENEAFIVSRAELDGQAAEMRILDKGDLARLGECLGTVDQSLTCS